MSETYSAPVYGPRLASQGSVLGKEIFIVGKNDGNAHLGGRCQPKLGIVQRMLDGKRQYMELMPFLSEAYENFSILVNLL